MRCKGKKNKVQGGISSDLRGGSYYSLYSGGVTAGIDLFKFKENSNTQNIRLCYC